MALLEEENLVNIAPLRLSSSFVPGRSQNPQFKEEIWDKLMNSVGNTIENMDNRPRI